jgi:hypothetical protein
MELKEETLMRPTGWRARAMMIGFGVALACAAIPPAAHAAEWIPGHYDPRGEWIPGHWGGEGQRRFEAAWEPGHYDRRGAWIPGHWIGDGPHRGPPPEDVRPPGGWREGRVWIPAHYDGARWEPGHWSDR